MVHLGFPVLIGRMREKRFAGCFIMPRSINGINIAAQKRHRTRTSWLRASQNPAVLAFNSGTVDIR